jgi:hypothetical protein
VWGDGDSPEWNALFGVSFIMCANLLAIAAIADASRLVSIDNAPKVVIISIGLIVLCANYIWLVHKGKYKRIAEKYKNESQPIRIRNAMLLWAYAVISLAIPFLCVTLSHKLGG